ncbi:MAG: phosphotransferase [Bacteroidetes bacterium]|jgi:5-methylthioribose kinase|nr:phosphotransferase [Bacteroidota bacterium]
MIGEDVLRYVQERRPDFAPAGPPERLPEGNLNVVWRVPGEPASIIAKWAPPYIAANPDVPLDPSRLVFEARSLHALAPGGPLAHVVTERVRPPRPLDMHTEPHILLMEDVGPHPTLGRWLRSDDATPEAAVRVGRQLGRFIGRLHAATVGDDALVQRFDNRAMQETRLAVQYEAVAEMLARAGVDDAAALGARAEALGRRLLAPGRCLTMGDLWPPSVLVAGRDLRIIDWELAHYGHPMQDIAHVAAHAWMQAHRAPDAATAQAARRLRAATLVAYRDALGVEAEALLTPSVLEDAAVHFGAEILVRAVGGFQAGYVYDGLPPEAPAVQEAVDTAAAHIRHPAEGEAFLVLNT